MKTLHRWHYFELVHNEMDCNLWTWKLESVMSEFLFSVTKNHRFSIWGEAGWPNETAVNLTKMKYLKPCISGPGGLRLKKTTIEKSKTWQLTATISINNKNEEYLCSVEAEIGSSAPMTQITDREMDGELFIYAWISEIFKNICGAQFKNEIKSIT